MLVRLSQLVLLPENARPALLAAGVPEAEVWGISVPSGRHRERQEVLGEGEAMSKQLTCRHPDRDCPKLLCGHPLPCPWHTVTIHADRTPPVIEVPTTATAALHNLGKLGDIAEAIKGE